MFVPSASKTGVSNTKHATAKIKFGINDDPLFPIPTGRANILRSCGSCCLTLTECQERLLKFLPCTKYDGHICLAQRQRSSSVSAAGVAIRHHSPTHGCGEERNA